MGNRGQLNDLPVDIGTDHQQRFAESDGVPGQPAGQGRSNTPGWVRWLAGVLVPNLFPSIEFSVRPFVVGLESIELSGGKKGRRYLLIQNNSPSDMYLNFGSDATPNGSIIIKANGGYYEPLRVPMNAIYISAASGASAGILVEGG